MISLFTISIYKIMKSVCFPSLRKNYEWYICFSDFFGIDLCVLFSYGPGWSIWFRKFSQIIYGLGPYLVLDHKLRPKISKSGSMKMSIQVLSTNLKLDICRRNLFWIVDIRNNTCIGFICLGFKGKVHAWPKISMYCAAFQNYQYRFQEKKTVHF